MTGEQERDQSQYVVVPNVRPQVELAPWRPPCWPSNPDRKATNQFPADLSADATGAHLAGSGAH